MESATTQLADWRWSLLPPLWCQQQQTVVDVKKRWVFDLFLNITLVSFQLLTIVSLKSYSQNTTGNNSVPYLMLELPSAYPHDNNSSHE